MTHDRQQFESHTLENGVTVWSHQMDVPFAQVRFLIPVGAVHSHKENGGRNGIAHLLEHMLFEQKGDTTDGRSLHDRILQSGGDWNGWTQPFTTEFFAQLPTEDFAHHIASIADHIFTPTFSEDELSIQRSIVKNENALRKYFPGDTELDHYGLTEWLPTTACSREQMFGTAADLDAIDVDLLQQFHQQHYSSRDLHVIVGGNVDITQIYETVARIPTHNTDPVAHTQSVEWNANDYHERTFAQLDGPIFFWGGTATDVEIETLYGLRFLANYLTDEMHGALYRWLRKEKGWTYGAESTVWYDRDRMGWTIRIPLADKEVVDHVRAELDTRIRDSILNQDMLTQYAKRASKLELFSFQTLDERITAATDEIATFGTVITEKGYQEQIEHWSDSRHLLALYEAHFSPERSSQFLALSTT